MLFQKFYGGMEVLLFMSRYYIDTVEVHILMEEHSIFLHMCNHLPDQDMFPAPSQYPQQRESLF